MIWKLLGCSVVGARFYCSMACLSIEKAWSFWLPRPLLALARKPLSRGKARDYSEPGLALKESPQFWPGSYSASKETTLVFDGVNPIQLIGMVAAVAQKLQSARRISLHISADSKNQSGMIVNYHHGWAHQHHRCAVDNFDFDCSQSIHCHHYSFSH